MSENQPKKYHLDPFGPSSQKGSSTPSTRNQMPRGTPKNIETTQPISRSAQSVSNSQQQNDSVDN